MKTSLVIFDCDGVLVDSEPLSNRVIAEQISSLGFPMTEKEAHSIFAGGSLEIVEKFILDKTGKPMPDYFEEEYRVRSTALFRSELVAIPGAEELLKSIKIPKCVGSNGPLSKIDENLRLTKMHHYFDGNFFSAYDIQKWKPLPDLYLYAAKKMGVDPAECVVVEDSVHGVQAAVAAGIKVYAYAGGGNGELLREAGAEVVTKMEELIGKF